MAGTISPAVCGKSTWYRLTSIYTVGQVVGAASTGLVLGAAGIWVHKRFAWETRTLEIVLGFLAGIGALHDVKLLPFRLPSRRWQVPQSWKRFHPSVMATFYGLGVGLGVVTRIPFASFYLVLFACGGLASLPVAAGIMALYGATRAGTVALVARGQGFAAKPHERLDIISRFTPLIGYLDGLVLALLAGFFLAQAFLALI